MWRAPLVEIFNSYQGEGIYLGQPMTFVRLAGCNLSCDYCDTGYARDARRYLWISGPELLRELRKHPIHQIVSFTGGEPLLYPDFLVGVFTALKRLKKKIYLETNGTQPESFRKVKRHLDIVAMDLKLPSATGQSFFKTAEEFLRLALPKKIFVKIVLTPQTEFSEIKKSVQIIRRVSRQIPLCFTPATSGNKFFDDWSKLNRLVNYAGRFLADVRLIPQVHKLIGCQ